ncbi:GYDIA family GHMP kinase [Riemerella columbina]|uniref:GYDIA family GHMP kinase n=1 Tax=Riemerella columbina TaxID=103810 RepID=UPI00267087D9|nr:GYDIA family GHMP kinase [Riemerella columbina]WKS95111.1 GYDIA family GHMP kinase [Riemerella columbina]
METFFSSGKLLLTSEYMVLEGALALAVPTKLGQSLQVEHQPEREPILLWQAYHQNQLWLSVEIDYQNEDILRTNHPKSAYFVLKVFQTLKKIAPKVFQQGGRYSFKTNLEFPADYGLGSSSTLMANLAKWAKADPYQLNELSLGGSGYDVAVAMLGQSILYQLKNGRQITPVVFAPDFKNELLLIHLNQKQDSREGIRWFKNRAKTQAEVDFFSELTQSVLESRSISDFSELMTAHEAQLSTLLGMPTVKERWFSDCPVFVKSLGAWGGDFVLTRTFSGDQDYFQQKGFSTTYAYSDLVL